MSEASEARPMRHAKNDGLWDTGVPVKTPDRDIAERLIMACVYVLTPFLYNQCIIYINFISCL